MTGRRMLLVLAVLALTLVATMAAVPWDTAADSADSASSETTVAATPEIESDSVVTASGYCGSSTASSSSYATWTYSRSSTTSILTISGGTVESRYNWTIESLTIDGEVISDSDLSSYTLSDVLKRSVSLTISGRISVGQNVLSYLVPTSVEISSGLTSISTGMFYNCTSLTTVSISTSVTAIGSSAFYGCTSLTTVSISTSVTSIGSDAFYGCTGLTSINIGVAQVDHSAFRGCTKLTTISVSTGSPYTVSNGFLLSDSGTTIYMCPTGRTGVISYSSIPSGVTKIYLDYANVLYALNQLNSSRSVTFERVADDANAYGMIYSSQGFRSCTPTFSSSAVTLTYTLYSGWAVVDDCMSVSGATVSTATSGRLVITIGSTGYCTVYPMGKATITYGELQNLSSVDGWTVTVSNPPSGTSTDVATAIDSGALELTITGYSGSGTATLSKTMYYYGVICSVESIQATSAGMAGLRNLTIGEGIEIDDDAFANCSGLVTVTADYVASVGARAFRYCTALETVSFASCTTFGAYAFEGCGNLVEINLEASSVTFGDSALVGCESLDLITVDTDTTVSGASGVTVLHYDTSTTSQHEFDVVGNYITIRWYFASTVSYEASSGETGTSQFYYGISTMYFAVVPAYGEVYITVTAGNCDSHCLVVFDEGVGGNTVFEEIYSNDTVDSYTPSTWGYEFRYWSYLSDDGYYLPYDFTTPVTESFVLVAVWSKENSIDSTPFYLLGIFVAAVAASFVIFGIARRQ